MHRKFKFIPVAPIIQQLVGYSGLSYARQFAAYQWFVARLDEYRKGRSCWEYLNGTSSINNFEPYPIHDYDEPFRRLAVLFAEIGTDSDRGDFLRYCKLNEWGDLQKPFIITVPHTDEFPKRSWFEMRGRRFAASPNSYHPEATWVMSGALQSNYKGLWGLNIEYGYPHDSSHWFEYISQAQGEPLDAFSRRIDSEIETLLLPETKLAQFRLNDERDWQAVHEGLQNCFRPGPTCSLGRWDTELADLLMGIEGYSLSAHRIKLTPERLQTLKEWIWETS